MKPPRASTILVVTSLALFVLCLTVHIQGGLGQQLSVNSTSPETESTGHNHSSFHHHSAHHSSTPVPFHHHSVHHHESNAPTTSTESPADEHEHEGSSNDEEDDEDDESDANEGAAVDNAPPSLSPLSQTNRTRETESGDNEEEEEDDSYSECTFNQFLMNLNLSSYLPTDRQQLKSEYEQYESNPSKFHQSPSVNFTLSRLKRLLKLAQSSSHNEIRSGLTSFLQNNYNLFLDLDLDPSCLGSIISIFAGIRRSELWAMKCKLLVVSIRSIHHLDRSPNGRLSSCLRSLTLSRHPIATIAKRSQIAPFTLAVSACEAR